MIHASNYVGAGQRGHGQGGNEGDSGGLSGGFPSWHVGIPTLIFYLVFSTYYP
jgi:hypothetical protein